MIPANIIYLDPQRIEEYESYKLEERLTDLYLTLSKSELKLVLEFIEIDWHNVVSLANFLKVLSSEERLIIKKLIDIIKRNPEENAEPCKIIHMQAK